MFFDFESLKAIGAGAAESTANNTTSKKKIKRGETRTADLRGISATPIHESYPTYDVTVKGETIVLTFGYDKFFDRPKNSTVNLSFLKGYIKPTLEVSYDVDTVTLAPTLYPGITFAMISEALKNATTTPRKVDIPTIDREKMFRVTAVENTDYVLFSRTIKGQKLFYLKKVERGDYAFYLRYNELAPQAKRKIFAKGGAVIIKYGALDRALRTYGFATYEIWCTHTALNGYIIEPERSCDCGESTLYKEKEICGDCRSNADDILDVTSKMRTLLSDARKARELLDLLKDGKGKLTKKEAGMARAVENILATFGGV